MDNILPTDRSPDRGKRMGYEIAKIKQNTTSRSIEADMFVLGCPTFRDMLHVAVGRARASERGGVHFGREMKSLTLPNRRADDDARRRR